MIRKAIKRAAAPIIDTLAFRKAQRLLTGDRIFFNRFQYAGAARTLARLITRENMAPLLIDPSGDCFVITHDGFYLYFNPHFDNGMTYGDGQSFDAHHKQYGVEFPERFLLENLADGMTYCDIGANNGYYYALKAARLRPGCRVVAVEPDRKILPHLNKNAERNGVQRNLEIAATALGNTTGTAHMTADLGASGFVVPEGGARAGLTQTPIDTFDNFTRARSLDRVDFIKVDIEGFEYNFLLGAQQALERFRPVLIMEWEDSHLRRAGASADSVLQLLKSRNYCVFDAAATSDIIAVPPEKQDALKLLDAGDLKRI